MVAYSCNPDIWKVEAGGPRVQGYLQVQRKFKTSLGYVRSTQKHAFVEEEEEEGTRGRERNREKANIN